MRFHTRIYLTKLLANITITLFAESLTMTLNSGYIFLSFIHIINEVQLIDVG